MKNVENKGVIQANADMHMSNESFKIAEKIRKHPQTARSENPRKRKIGEFVRATKKENMYHEAELKYIFYNAICNDLLRLRYDRYSYFGENRNLSLIEKMEDMVMQQSTCLKSFK